MKYIIASDLHGSAKYVERLMEAWDREQADGMLLLGDVLYHGPRNDLPEGYDTKRCVQLLNPRYRSITAVRGNCDAEVDQMVLEFPLLLDGMNYIADGRRPSRSPWSRGCKTPSGPAPTAGRWGIRYPPCRSRR